MQCTKFIANTEAGSPPDKKVLRSTPHPPQKRTGTLHHQVHRMRCSRRRHPPATRRPPAPPWASCRRRSTATRRSASYLRKEKKLHNFSSSSPSTRTILPPRASETAPLISQQTQPARPGATKAHQKISAKKRSPAAEELDEAPPPKPLPSLAVPLIPSTPSQQQAAARLAARVWIWERRR
jgi:hypothetical protein